MTKLNYARMFMNLGISIIPLIHRSKEPEDSLTGGTWNQFFTISNTEYQLMSWFGSGWLNYGVVCGWNNLVVIDFDLMEYFSIWQLLFPSLADTAFKVFTSRGMHVYVQTIAPACNDKRIAKSGGIDVQAQRRFVVGPGCVHPNGTEYVPVGDMVFPLVQDIESILPLDIFPRVHVDTTNEMITPVHFVAPSIEYDPMQMAMFPNQLDLIDTVKSRVRIETLFANVKKTSVDGRWFAALCPFHDDHNPSLWIDAKRQICGCAVCGMRPMDVINLYARQHNLNESDAVRAMAKELGVWG